MLSQDDLGTVRDVVLAYKVPAPARLGSIAPVDVIVPAGGTGMDPSQTSFFQVLNIPTKINKGTVEIVSDVFLVKAGDKARRRAAYLSFTSRHAAARLRHLAQRESRETATISILAPDAQRRGE